MFNTVGIDMEKINSLAQTINRFKVNEGEAHVPVLLLRLPTDPAYSTVPVRKHWFEDDDNNSTIIPCGQSVGTGGKCLVCDFREEALKSGTFNNLGKSNQDALNGMTSHETQLIDLRKGIPQIHAYQQAILAKDPARIQTALAALHQVIMAEQVKTWSFSRTVFNEIRKSILAFQNDNMGQFSDPTDPNGVRILWVGKEKVGKKMPTYAVRFAWNNPPIPLPEALFDLQPGGSFGPLCRVKNYDELFAEFVRGVAFWPESRIREALAASAPTIAGCMNPGNPVYRLQQSPPPLSLPGQQGNYGAPNNLGFAPSAPQTVTRPTVVVPPEAITVQLTPGATMGAGELTCFGKTFNFGADKCRACPKNVDCMQKMSQQMMQATAPANAAMPTPPKAEATTAKSSVQDIVDKALADASKG